MLSDHRELYRTLGINIAYYRKLRGLTQIQLAENVDLSRTHISNIEAPNVETSVSLETLFCIADMLSVPVSELFVDHFRTVNPEIDYDINLK